MGVTANAGSDNLEAMALKTLSPAQAGLDGLDVWVSYWFGFGFGFGFGLFFV